MIRKIIAIIVSLIAGAFVIGLIESSNFLFYEIPKEAAEGDPEAIKNLPLGAFISIIIAHGIGAFVAGAVCNLISKGPWVLGVVLIAELLLAAGLLNTWWVPHPQWFAFADPLVYFPATFLGAGIVEFFFGGRRSQNSNNWLASNKNTDINVDGLA